jgi:hypothetical protein
MQQNQKGCLIFEKTRYIYIASNEIILSQANIFLKAGGGSKLGYLEDV